VIDTEPVSYSDPWIQTVAGLQNPGTLSVVLAQDALTGQPAATVQTRAYHLEYIPNDNDGDPNDNDNRWRAKMYDINGQSIVIGYDTNNDSPIYYTSGPMQTLADESNEWVFNIPDQVTMTIKKPGNLAFSATNHYFRFNVFRTANPMGVKISEIAPGRLEFPINVTNF
jgi:hypothetical protein